MKELILISDDKEIKRVKVGDNISKKQIGDKIKFLYGDASFCITYKLKEYKHVL